MTLSTKPLSRRTVIAGSAAVLTPRCRAFPWRSGAEGASGLVSRYFEEVATFNMNDFENWDWDDLINPDAPHDVTMRKMIGVPVRTADDATAAVEFLIREGEATSISLDADGLDWGRVCHSLVVELHAYLRRQAGLA